jgi:PPOX class probable F420-dependent enzyme
MGAGRGATDPGFARLAVDLSVIGESIDDRARRLGDLLRVRSLVMTELSPDVRALFEGPNYAHIATVLPDGGPHSVPVWVGLEGDRIAFFTQPGTRKARNLAADPRVALSIADHENPYRMATVRGRVVDTVEGDAAFEIIDRLSERYTGQPFPMRSGIVFLVEPERAFAMALPFEHAPAA